MDDITVDKAALLKTLQENLGKHRAIFQEAVEGYRKRAIEELEAHIQRIRTGDLVKVYVSLPAPELHEAEYERAIAMLEWDKGREVVLDETTFAQLVLDDWAWKRAFLMSAGRFSDTASREYREKFRDD